MLQCFGHLKLRADSLETALMLGKIEGRRRRGGQDEMVRSHPTLSGHEFEQAPRDGERQGSLVCCSPWGLRVGQDWVTQQQQRESWNFPDGSEGKGYACNVGNMGSVPGSGRSPGEGNGYRLQYSCLDCTLQYSQWGCKESEMTEQLTLFFRGSWVSCPVKATASLTWVLRNH